MKHLLGIRTLGKENITRILDLADEFKPLVLSHETCDRLKGRRVTALFYENSTRTRTSFELAARALSADFNYLDVATSSVNKGESLVDTLKTLEALGTDIVVIRHRASGTPLFLTQNCSLSVVNAGDGANEHPTQALLDFMTMREKFGKIEGLRVAIVGDVAHSRVARSNLWGLTAMGASVVLCGPATLLPKELSAFCEVTTDPVRAVRGANVVMGLRLQLERQQQGLLPGIKEYNALYGISDELLSYAAADAIVMHPGPVNRGAEINSSVLGSEKSYIERQVTNGVAVRMSVLALVGDELGR